jgi:hypothetical protein
VNDATTFLSFARGLPTRLSVRCIDIDSRENVEQWAGADGNTKRTGYKKRSIHDDYNTVSNAMEKSQQK